MNTPLVSIIITTKNSSNFVEQCIKAVLSQSYKNIEIILVDNYSQDNTVDIANKLGVNTFLKGPERSAQRNYGASQALGEIVGFLDVDMEISHLVVESCVSNLLDESVSGVYVPERIYGRSFLNRVRDFERSFYNATVIDAARFFNLNDFLRLGGYDENLNGTEDWDLDRRFKGVGCLKLIDAPLYHHERAGLFQYILKKSYYASNFNLYFKKWGIDKTTKRQFGFLYRYFGVFIENGKWRKLLRHPIYTLYMYSLRFIIGVVYILSRLNLSRKSSVYNASKDS